MDNLSTEFCLSLSCFMMEDRTESAGNTSRSSSEPSESHNMDSSADSLHDCTQNIELLCGICYKELSSKVCEK